MSLRSLLKRLILENAGYVKEEEKGNVLDLRKPLDSGFCEYNPQINQYAQSSPETLAEMIIFVIATQQQGWYDVVP